MPTFFSSKEMYDVLTPYYHSLTLDREVGDLFTTLGLSLRLKHRNPGGVFYLDMRRNPARLLVGRSALDATPDVELDLDADSVHAFWLGGLNLPLAVAAGKAAASGQVGELSRILRTFARADGRYRAHLHAIGRDDLA
ncbi:hypothetical protein BJF78_32085 [Pseudonocardia sp. CNS-139]|nr:hypothetical protein BJF78_32085 [Pseudonocardia sp. CNS-139]